MQQLSQQQRGMKAQRAGPARRGVAVPAMLSGSTTSVSSLNWLAGSARIEQPLLRSSVVPQVAAVSAPTVEKVATKPGSGSTVAAVIARTEQLSNLKAALKSVPGMWETVSSQEFTGTVILPTNAAFKNLTNALELDSFQDLLELNTLLPKVLLYHVLPSKVCSGSFEDDTTITLPTMIGDAALVGKNLVLNQDSIGRITVTGRASSGTVTKMIQVNDKASVLMVDSVLLPFDLEIAALFEQWNAALQTNDAEKVADMYHPEDTLLLPTVSNTPRVDRASIVDYFKAFLTKRPYGTIDQSMVRRLSANVAEHAGIYTFAFHDEAGNETQKVQARFTFIYKKLNGKWFIAKHHSSAMPEAIPLPEPVPPTEDEVRSFFDTWNSALATLDPENVADLYAPDGVLLPTISNKVRTNHKEIVDYFKDFLTRKPQGVVNESYVKVMSPSLASHSGIYTFTLTDPRTGSTSDVSARFSFTYRKEGDQWFIIEHHSSGLPQQTLPTEDQIKGLFTKWNAALSTLSPEAVADLYAHDSVLLPTISNKVRTTREEIISYFKDFLARQPQGVVKESYVKIMNGGLASHSGIYTFTLTDPKTGDVSEVSARFSFTYRKEGGDWLISEHHSSALPEAVLPSEETIRGLFDRWNGALATLSPEAVADLYAPDGVLLPTISNKVRTTRHEIIDYFKDFLARKPQGVVEQSHVKIMGANLASHSGIYTFTLTDPNGSTHKVSARFSFTYRKDGHRWLITEHHSSGLPQQTLPTEDAIRGLFDQWNAALGTLNPEKVADLYTWDGVLLPTISNKVRSTREEIVDYFTDFLTRKPQGVVKESYIRAMSATLASHSGIYAFTLTDPKTGSKSEVSARFSFTYRKEGDKWLISEHHSSALPQPVLPTEDQIKALFDKWNSALATLVPENVADLYASDGVLLPTISNEVRTTRHGIIDYFKSFLAAKPQGTVDQSHVKIMGANLASHSGIYTFALTDATGHVSRVSARFSFTYRKDGDEWLIVEHHSSTLPQPTLPTEGEIKALFDQWNAALATLKPENVADLYTADGVLLPTISNKVRTSRDEIIDYFKAFLTRKPQGVVSESYVRAMGANLASHCGIYTFTLTDPATGAKSDVSARFSFTYRKESGKWLISEHHSSALPEPVSVAVAAAAAM